MASKFEEQMKKRFQERTARATHSSSKDENENTNSKPVTPAAEWVWVTGYKGTDRDMKCRNYQYEMGKLHQMPEDEAVIDCASGFHLCLNMNDVAKYYEIGDGHRYFEVQALVRKKHYDKYGMPDSECRGWFTLSFEDPIRDKLAAKSIVFTRELTIDEILKDTKAAEWDDEYKQMTIEKGIKKTINIIHARELATLGYSEAFAQYISENGKYEVAKQVASQKELSMDMKVLCILSDNH